MRDSATLVADSVLLDVDARFDDLAGEYAVVQGTLLQVEHEIAAATGAKMNHHHACGADDLPHHPKELVVDIAGGDLLPLEEPTACVVEVAAGPAAEP